MELSAEQELGLSLLKKDQNIPIDHRSEGSCMWYANCGLCGGECPKFLEGECPIPDEIEEISGVKLDEL